jgi:hypothetical protein
MTKQTLPGKHERTKKKERIYMRIQHGYIEPADAYSTTQLRAKGYKVGDVVAVTLLKLRSPKFNRLVHRIGQLVVANIEAFSGLDAHQAVKRLQIEGRVACDEIGIMVSGFGMVIQFIPRSLSFDTMDEAEFVEAARGICRTIAERYWNTLTPKQIEEMAESFVEET